MNTRHFLGATPLVLLSAVFAFSQEKDDAKLLKGQWEVTKMIKRGDEQPLDKAMMTLSFSGNKVTLEARGDKRSFTFKLEPKKKLREIDLTALDGSFKGQTSPGIYELAGDTLTLCLPHDKNKKRPNAFESLNDREASRILFTLKRVKQ